MGSPRKQRSLRFRLLAATLLAMMLALGLSGWLLSSLFRDHVMRQFSQSLTAQLDQVTARLEFNAAGQPQIDPQALSDPRWSRPYSGLYWQVDRADATPLNGALRSRSLWDATLKPPGDALADGEVHLHEVAGPNGASLMLVERTVARGGAAPSSWRLMIAGDLAETAAAIARFNGVLAASLAILLGLLSAAAVAQVAVGLAPLRGLQRALSAVHEGRSQRLDEKFPAELQPLVDDFNRVLDRNTEVVVRARTQAGNLAHAIKTPLAVLSQAAASAAAASAASAAVASATTASADTAAVGSTAGPAKVLPPVSELAALVDEQVTLARRHVDWHLARSRAAAAHGVPGARVAVQPALSGLIRVMERVHADRGLTLRCDPVSPKVSFAGELQDLQEIMGNLIDNACKWARSEVHLAASVQAATAGRRLRITVDDDGPGIAPEGRNSVMARGARLDEAVPGSGLGLGIVHELVSLYGGSVTLATAPGGGLRVELDLPGA